MTTSATPGHGGGGWRGPALFSYGFRPFFLFGALHAAIMIGLWVPWYLGFLGLASGFPPTAWHAHELLFGYVPAVMAGFLLTAIPRRTGSAPPGAVTMIVAIAAPVGTAAFAWNHRWAASQVCWFALVIALVTFAAKRFGHGSRRPPASFVWVPMSFAMGVCGSIVSPYNDTCEGSSAIASATSRSQFRPRSAGSEKMRSSDQLAMPPSRM